MVVVAMVVAVIIATTGSSSVPAAVAPTIPTPTVQPYAPVPSPATDQPTATLDTALVSVSGTAADEPSAAALVALLDRHFSAINAKDFDSWTQTVTTRRATSISAAKWRTNYESTQDGSVQVRGITGDATNAVIDLSFVSQQNVSDAPSDVATSRVCWQSTWPAVNTGGGWVLDTPSPGSTTKQAC